MEWTIEHDMLFCCEVIPFDLYQYKPGFNKRGQYLDRIAESLNSVVEPWFKVDQRLLRDRTRKLLKLYVEKRNKVEVQHTELDDLLLDINEQQEQPEVEATKASETNRKKLRKERQEAEETRRLSTERLSETQKRRSNSDDDFDATSTKQKLTRSKGSGTIAYLRGKTEKDFELRAKELKLKTGKLDMKKIGKKLYKTT